MNKIGIIVAMEEELEAVLNIMNNIEQKEIYGISAVSSTHLDVYKRQVIQCLLQMF